MDYIVLKNKCTGCTACMNICPKKAISMVVDSDGFRHPIIDKSKCIDCGACRKICPVLNTKKNIALNECYAAFNNSDEEKITSSSGGIFHLLATNILKDGGIVIGAAFENNKLNHIAINSIDELEQLKGSKYLQSNLGDIFKYIKNNIPTKKVLFVGTPCQVAGLKAYIKKDYDNLLCVDFICHGVPSPKLFDKYINELEHKYNKEVSKVDFRDKSTGWTTYSTTVYLKNIKEVIPHNENNYMKLFLSDIALRESCYNCNFKLGNKYSDITLGDFWGIKDKLPTMYNQKGVSAVIINTKAGQDIFNKLKNDITYQPCSINDITAHNLSLVNSSDYPKNRPKFFNELNKYSINKLSIKYYKKNRFIYKLIKKIQKILKIH